MTQNESLHLAAQYLATAAISFLPSRDDDSHTNLGRNEDEKRLETHDLDDEGLRLTLNYEEYSLDFVHPKSGIGASYPLGGARHFDLKNWIEREAKFCGIEKDYSFDLHYSIPNLEILTDDFKFPASDDQELKKLIQLRWLSNKVLDMVVNSFDSATDIRIWPHHFDTGVLAYFDKSKEVSLGLGLAIPDDKVDDWYFYASGYHGSDSIQTNNFKPLKNGEWRSGDWNAAVLKASGASLPMVSSFFNEVVKTF